MRYTLDLPENEEEIQLSDILKQVRENLIEVNSFDEDFEDMEKQYIDSINELNQSLGEIKLAETENTNETQKVLGSFGFQKFELPPLLCKHPPPASGKDDDLNNVKEIMDEAMLKLGYQSGVKKQTERILCGADKKMETTYYNLCR